MASNNNNSNSDSDKQQKMKKQLEERKDEILLFDRFRSIATRKLESMTRQSEQTGITYQMGEKEKQVLREMQGMGLKEGVAAGLVTFLILRRGPIYVARWASSRRAGLVQQPGMTTPPSRSSSRSSSSSHGGGGGYQLSNPNTGTPLVGGGGGGGSSGANPFQKVNHPPSEFPPRSGNRFLRGGWFLLDTTLSLMMAASVSMTYTDTDQIRQQLLELPLIEGRSLTADALCEEISNELSKVQQEDNSHNRAYQRLLMTTKQQHHQWENTNHTTANNHETTTSSSSSQSSPSSFYLQGIIDFSENCQRRRFVERRLRQEQGLGKQDAVEIPPPGVPKDGPRLLVVFSTNGGEQEERVVYDNGDDDHNNNNNNNAENHPFDDSSFTSTTTTDWKDDTNWADDFVADQEEQDRKRR
jgi:hypothetical protein